MFDDFQDENRSQKSKKNVINYYLAGVKWIKKL